MMRTWRMLLLLACGLTGCNNGPKLSEAERLYFRGVALTESQPEEALRLIEEALTFDPRSPRALHSKVVLLTRLGRDQEAMIELARLEAIEPRVGEPLRRDFYLAAYPTFDIARDAYHQGDYALSLKKCETALLYDPTLGDAWVGKGLALAALNRADEALACYEKAIQVEPDNAYGWANRGEQYSGQGRWSEAIADFTRAIELEPDNGEVRENRAKAYEALDQPEKAAEDRRIAEELKQQAPADADHQTD